MDRLLAIRRQMFGAKTITFADPVVEQICATNWGNGTSITYAQAAKVTNLGGAFQNNTSIVSFDELQYFTGITTFNYYGNTATGTFSGCTNLVSVVLPSSARTLYSTFKGCTKLQSVGSLANITTLTHSPFMDCTSLAITVYMPNLTSISDHAFIRSGVTSVTSLGSITAMSGGTYNDQGVFRGCTSLTSVVLPSTLTSIGTNTFRGCSSLATINLPTSITAIGATAFIGSIINCSVNLPNLTSLGLGAFYGTKITSIVSLGSVTSILGGTSNQQGSFMNCVDLESAILPSTLTSIGINAFNGCSKITTITIPSTVTTINQFAFKECTSLATVYYSGNSTFTIGARAFQRCPLTTFPTTSISSCSGDYNFHGNNLATIELSASFTSVGYGGFIRNRKVATNVIVRATTPPTINTRVFWYDRGGGSFYINTLLKIYVPYSSDHSILAAYKSGTNWSDYSSYIFELDENGNIPT